MGYADNREVICFLSEIWFKCALFVLFGNSSQEDPHIFEKLLSRLVFTVLEITPRNRRCALKGILIQKLGSSSPEGKKYRDNELLIFPLGSLLKSRKQKSIMAIPHTGIL